MNIVTTIRKWNAYNRTVRDLNSLNNHMLNDIGVNRGDIQRLARDYANQL